jgi:hypothetical protein
LPFIPQASIPNILHVDSRSLHTLPLFFGSQYVFLTNYVCQVFYMYSQSWKEILEIFVMLLLFIANWSAKYRIQQNIPIFLVQAVPL